MQQCDNDTAATRLAKAFDEAFDRSQQKPETFYKAFEKIWQDTSPFLGSVPLKNQVSILLSQLDADEAAIDFEEARSAAFDVLILAGMTCAQLMNY